MHATFTTPRDAFDYASSVNHHPANRGRMRAYVSRTNDGEYSVNVQKDLPGAHAPAGLFARGARV